MGYQVLADNNTRRWVRRGEVGERGAGMSTHAIQHLEEDMITWGDIQATGPFSDLGVLVLAQLLVMVQHNRGALVCHAKLVGVH